MYEFIDTIESAEGASLPSEAVQINGEYIENQIEGYRTLTVEGREALSPEISFFNTGNRDGSVRKSKRYPARTIRITYQLKAASNEAFREAYNKLGRILDVEDAVLIFNDEQDKYYKGTPSAIGEVPPGKNTVIGEFEILCLDPFKYSVTEYEAEPNLDSGSIIIDYGGTYKSFPTLQAEFFNEDEISEDGEEVAALTGSGDCGYVAFFNESEKIIQLGDPDEVDREETAYESSQTLINQSFKNSNSWGTAAQSLWSLNSGSTFNEEVEQVDTLGMAVASYTNPMPVYGDYTTILTATSTANEPAVNYKVMACYDQREANSVRVTVSVRATLGSSASYIGKGYVIKAKVVIGGDTHTLNIKTTDYYWRGTAALTRSFTTTLSIGQNETSLSGITFEAYRDDDTGGTAGTLDATKCNNINIAAFPVPEPDTYYLTASNSGGATGWHGACITRDIPVDASGATGAVNFSLTYAHKLCITEGYGGHDEFGSFEVSLSDASQNVIAGVHVNKRVGGKDASLCFYVNGTLMESMDVNVYHNSSCFTERRQSSITKSGQTVTFNVCGISKTYNDAEIAESAATTITIALTSYGNMELEHNGLCWVKFVKNNCDTWRNIPNKFSANDVIEADCKDGAIYLNGVSAPVYGALGNDWEEFYLKPGINQIGFSYSNWVTSAPSFKVKYREVFL